MGIRIQPKEVTIPDDPKGDPFKDDLLNRKESVEILTHLITSIEGPCTMAVDAPWGAGKTTFINMWDQYLRNNGLTVVKFSAWENDFCGDPFAALCVELATAKNTGIDKEKLMEAGEKVIKHVTGNAMNQLVAAITAGTINLQELVKSDETDITKRLDQYQDAKRAIKEFRDLLRNMATHASCEQQYTPLIVMIDELDRCRPSYAVEFLEVAKHLFTVDNIVFVLAVNRTELAHSVSAIYGAGFDADGYLQRFFDVDFRLPEPHRSAFIVSLIDKIQINNYFGRTQDTDSQRLFQRALTLLQEFSTTFSLSLRQIQQLVHRLGLVFASLPGNQYSFFLSATVALTLRAINPQVYHEFINGRVSDLEVVDNIFNSHKEANHLQQTHEGCLFEAILIMAHKEVAKNLRPHSDNEASQTPLESRYREKQSACTEKSVESPTNEHWDEVLALVDSYQRSPIIRNQCGFMISVKRVELMTGEMIDKTLEFK